MIIKIFKVDKSIVLSIVIASEIICTDTAHTQSSGCFTRVSPVRPKIEVYLHYADPTPIGVDDASSIPPALCLLASKAGRYEVVLAGAQVWVPRSEFSTGQTSVQPISTRQYAPAAGPAASANPGANGSVTTQVGQGAESGGVKTLDRRYSGGKSERESQPEARSCAGRHMGRVGPIRPGLRCKNSCHLPRWSSQLLTSTSRSAPVGSSAEALLRRPAE